MYLYQVHHMTAICLKLWPVQQQCVRKLEPCCKSAVKEGSRSSVFSVLLLHFLLQHGHPYRLMQLGTSAFDRLFWEIARDGIPISAQALSSLPPFVPWARQTVTKVRKASLVAVTKEQTGSGESMLRSQVQKNDDHTGQKQQDPQ